MGYKTCPYCGANLDPEETCDCQKVNKKRETPASEFPCSIFNIDQGEKQEAVSFVNGRENGA